MDNRKCIDCGLTFKPILEEHVLCGRCEGLRWLRKKRESKTHTIVCDHCGKKTSVQCQF